MLLKVRAGAKGGKRRNVPIPRRTVIAVDAYLDERVGCHGPVTGRSRLFVRPTAARSPSSSSIGRCDASRRPPASPRRTGQWLMKVAERALGREIPTESSDCLPPARSRRRRAACAAELIAEVADVGRFKHSDAFARHNSTPRSKRIFPFGRECADMGKGDEGHSIEGSRDEGPRTRATLGVTERRAGAIARNDTPSSDTGPRARRNLVAAGATEGRCPLGGSDHHSQGGHVPACYSLPARRQPHTTVLMNQLAPPMKVAPSRGGTVSVPVGIADADPITGGSE